MEYLKHGTLGMTVGHEIGHAFDNEGRLFDATDRLANWWTNTSLAAFNAGSECFVRQYDNFTVQGQDGRSHSVNGSYTLDENIADNGGVKTAYEAWQLQYRSDPLSRIHNNRRLPGLDALTSEQLFFIQFGRYHCLKIQPDIQVALLAGSVHSPSKWRAIGVAQNSEYVAKAFNCKPGTPMNPVKKCDLL
ncbi:unnamed protein product [Mortierella alpina]